MKDFFNFGFESVINTTYRMLRAPFVLSLSIAAMALAFNPLSLIVAGLIYNARMGGANLSEAEVQSINFLPPLLSNRILGYDQLARNMVEDDLPAGVGVLFSSHLKEFFWLVLLGAVGVGTYFAGPIASISLPLGLTVAALGSLAVVHIAAMIGKRIKGATPLTQNKGQGEDMGGLYQASYSDKAGVYENLTLRQRTQREMTYFVDEAYLARPLCSSLFTGGKRLSPEVQKTVHNYTRNRL